MSKSLNIRECIQKFPDWPPGARTAQIVKLCATRCSCFAILWISLVNFAATNLCIASQRVFIVVVYFVMDSVRKLFDILSYSKFPPWQNSFITASPSQNVCNPTPKREGQKKMIFRTSLEFLYYRDKYFCCLIQNSHNFDKLDARILMTNEEQFR
jgi:hypothetical protein